MFPSPITMPDFKQSVTDKIKTIIARLVQAKFMMGDIFIVQATTVLMFWKNQSVVSHLEVLSARMLSYDKVRYCQI